MSHLCAQAMSEVLRNCLYALCDLDRKFSTFGFVLSNTIFDGILLIIGSSITGLKFLTGPFTFPCFGNETKIPTPVSMSLCFSKASFTMVGRLL